MKIQTKTIVTVAMMTAVLCLIAPISIPMGTIQFTAQTLVVAMIGTFLGAKLGSLSVAVWLLMGACGLPVYSGVRGGLGVLFGITGGFLLAFPALAALSGIKRDTRLPHFAFCLVGLAATYLGGSAWFCVFRAGGLSGAFAPEAVQTALTACVYPFVIKDVLSIAAGAALGQTLRSRIKIGVAKK